MISRQMIDSVCPFCSLPDERIVLANEHAVVIRDAYPVSPGHTLVIPRRHFRVALLLATNQVTDVFAVCRVMELADPRPDPAILLFS